MPASLVPARVGRFTRVAGGGPGDPFALVGSLHRRRCRCPVGVMAPAWAVSRSGRPWWHTLILFNITTITIKSHAVKYSIKIYKKHFNNYFILLLISLNRANAAVPLIEWRMKRSYIFNSDNEFNQLFSLLKLSYVII